MKIWIDLANSPQVLFFRPLLREFEKQGHTTIVTTRAYAQTTQLADHFGISHTVIGQHGGRGFFSLAKQNLLRSLVLLNWARCQHLDLAVSHNSYSQAVAARFLSIPLVTTMDYEYQPLNHLCFRLAQRVIVPQVFPDKMLRKFGARRKTLRYPGVKEQVYLADYKPSQDFRQQEAIPVDKPLIVLRPPAPWTAYHRFENDLFDQLLSFLDAREEIYTLFLPRIPSQVESVQHVKHLHVAQKVYDGPDLLFHADAVISGGGTMNREAAVLGTPTYTIFQGNLGAVDRYLIDAGRMKEIVCTDDFKKIRLEQVEKTAFYHLQPGIIEQMTAMFLDGMGDQRRG